MAGGAVFVVLQGLGWFLFATALLFQLLILWGLDWALNHTFLLPLVTTLGSSGLMLLTVSFRVFKPDKPHFHNSQTKPTLCLKRHERQILQQLAQDVLQTHPDASALLSRLVTDTPKSCKKHRSKKVSPDKSRSSGLLFALSILSFVLFCSSEVLLSQKHQGLATGLFHVAVVLSVSVVLFTHIWYMKRCYGGRVSIFMPFDGGVNFCTFQACGWILFSSAIVGVSCVISLKPLVISTPTSGVILVIGIIFFSAQIVLNISVPLFRPECSMSTKLSQALMQQLTLGLSVISLLLLATVDVLLCLQSSQLSYSLSVAAVIGIFLSLPLSYWRKAPGLSWCHNTVLQIMACFVWSFSCLLGLVLCMSIKPIAVGTEVSQLPQALMGSSLSSSNFGLITGSSGIFSQVMLLLALSPRGAIQKGHNDAFRAVISTCRKLAGCIAFAFGYWIVLPLLRCWLNGPMYLYGIWSKQQGLLSQDSLAFYHNVDLERGVAYGDGPMEYMDVLTPTSAVQHTKLAPIMYVHGGGWVCVNTELLSHSVAPLCRAGHQVCVVEFPKAPENPYPAALISVLRACRFLYKQGHTEVALLGDSAGGNLATMAAALLTNRDLLQQFATTVEEPVLRWKLPSVERVASIYGIYDDHTWRSTWTGIVLGFCYSCYLPESNRCKYNQVTLGDIPTDELKGYPDSLLVCGTLDGVLDSARYAKAKLTEAGCDCKLLEYPAPHAFHGFPIQWTLGHWKTASLPTTEELIAFFTQQPLQKLPATDVPFDWSLPVWFVASTALPILLILLPIISIFL